MTVSHENHRPTEQCAAVTYVVGLMSVPPQKCCPKLCIVAIQGYLKFGVTSYPPTMLFSVKSAGLKSVSFPEGRADAHRRIVKIDANIALIAGRRFTPAKRPIIPNKCGLRVQ